VVVAALPSCPTILLLLVAVVEERLTLPLTVAVVVVVVTGHQKEHLAELPEQRKLHYQF
jgi:hypothetical protein